MIRFLFTSLGCIVTSLLVAQPIEMTVRSQWSNNELVPSAAHNNTYNEVWGYAINGLEYAIIGSTDGTHILDVTDPDNITESFFIKGAVTGPSIIHRDYHDYEGYLYAVADEGSQSTLQIIDLNALPDTVTLVYNSNELFNRAHNIFIDSAKARLYTLAERGGPSGSTAFSIYDISEPINPTKLASHDQLGGNNIGHVHDAFVRNDTAFLNCGYNGFYLVDMIDPVNPVVFDLMEDYPDAGYNHSGWLTPDGRYYYMADENHGYDLKVLDVTDVHATEVISTFNADSKDASSIAHNPIVACNYLYIAYYYDGLQVFDISDPTNPQSAFYYNTSKEPNLSQYRGAWGVYPFLPSGNVLVSDMQEGLFVIEAIDNTCNKIISKTEEIIEGSNLSIFPNPSHGVFEISGLGSENIHSISVFNQQGVVVLQDPGLDNDKLRVNLEPGIYYVRFQLESSMVTRRIILL